MQRFLSRFVATRVSDYLDIYIVYKPVAIAAGFFYLNMNTRIIGNHSEQIVADYLVKNGYRILARNYRISSAEIDIIASKKMCINFIEVKKIPKSWDGIDISAKVDAQKKFKIKKAASSYLAECSKIKYDYISFDVAIVVNGVVTVYYGAF